MKALEDYFKKREDAILDLLGKPGRKFTVGTFHELRVEIKKLNALFDLIHFCAPGFKRKKTFKPFKRIFRQAGKVRELQLEEALFDERFDHASGDYRKQLKKLRTKEREAFFSMPTKRLTRRMKKKHRVIVTALSRLNRKKVEQYLEEKKEEIKEVLHQTPLQAEQIHEARKLLKTFNYNRMILASEKQKALLKKEPLSPLMGEWHDCQVTINRLQTAIDSGKIDEEEIRQLETMKAAIAADRKKLFDQLNSAIPASEFFEEEQ